MASGHSSYRASTACYHGVRQDHLITPRELESRATNDLKMDNFLIKEDGIWVIHLESCVKVQEHHLSQVSIAVSLQVSILVDMYTKYQRGI